MDLKDQCTQQTNRVLTNSKFGLFYSNFLILTPTFSQVPIEKYGKTPTFSDKQHFNSYFQNPSENSGPMYPTDQYIQQINVTNRPMYLTDQCTQHTNVPKRPIYPTDQCT